MQPAAANWELQALDSAANKCPNCTQTLKPFTLAGHYGKWLNVEVCEPCHLIWFERFESVKLSALGVLSLVREIVQAHGRTHTQTLPRWRCPSCAAELQLIRDKTRYGEMQQHRCPSGHGAAQTFAQYLAEKGMLRPLSRKEVSSLMIAHQAADTDNKTLPSKPLFCVNCGALHRPLHSGQSTCHYCASPYLALDLAGLMAVIDPYDATSDNVAAQAIRMLPASQKQLSCMHCGFSLDATKHSQCPSCGETITLTDLRFAVQLLEAIAPQIEQHHSRMAPKEAEARLAITHGDKQAGVGRFSDKLPMENKVNLHFNDYSMSFVAKVGLLIAAVAIVIILYLVKHGI